MSARIDFSDAYTQDPPPVDFSDVGSTPAPQKNSVRDKVLGIARRVGISDDIADDFLKITGGIESGNRHYGKNGKVLESAPDPHTGERAVGFSQIKPSTIKQFNLDPYNEDQNIEGGLRYFAQGGDDPVGRRIYYFGGPGAYRKFKRTGRVPSGGDVTGTTFNKYIQATGGNDAPKPVIDFSDADDNSTSSELPTVTEDSRAALRDQLGLQQPTYAGSRTIERAPVDFSDNEPSRDEMQATAASTSVIAPNATPDPTVAQTSSLRPLTEHEASRTDEFAPASNEVVEGQQQRNAVSEISDQALSLNQARRVARRQRLNQLRERQRQVQQQRLNETERQRQAEEIRAANQQAVTGAVGLPPSTPEAPEVFKQPQGKGFTFAQGYRPAPSYTKQPLVEPYQPKQGMSRDDLRRALRQQIKDSGIEYSGQVSESDLDGMADYRLNALEAESATQARIAASLTPEDHQEVQRLTQLFTNRPLYRRAISLGLDRSADNIPQMATGIWRMIADATGSKNIRKLADEGMQSTLVRKMAEEATTQKLSTTEQRIAAGTDLIGNLIQLAALSEVAGPEAVLGAQGGLSTLGQGGSYSKAAGETGKGILYGRFFKTLPYLEPYKGAQGALQRLANLSTDIGLVGTGTYAIERATGASHQQALKSALQNSALSGFLRATDVIRTVQQGAASASGALRKPAFGEAVEPEPGARVQVRQPDGSVAVGNVPEVSKYPVTPEGTVPVELESGQSVVANIRDVKIVPEPKGRLTTGEKESALDNLRQAPDEASFNVAVNQARQAGVTEEEINTALKPTVPESKATLAAQEESARSPESPRAAIFYPKSSGVPETQSGFIRVPLPDGFLLLNRKKARSLGLGSIKSIQDYVAQNGIEPLIGKVAPVQDTSQGAALRTEDDEGNELSTSIVTTPEVAQAQAEVDQAQFPQATSQTVLPAQEAAQRRIDDVQPPSQTTAEELSQDFSQQRRGSTPERQPESVATAQEAGETSPTPARQWRHADFGLVTEAKNQKGVATGKVRVVDKQGREHAIWPSNGRGEGNTLAVPVRKGLVIEQAPVETQPQPVESQPQPVSDETLAIIPRSELNKSDVVEAQQSGKIPLMSDDQPRLMSGSDEAAKGQEGTSGRLTWQPRGKSTSPVGMTEEEFNQAAASDRNFEGEVERIGRTIHATDADALPAAIRTYAREFTASNPELVRKFSQTKPSNVVTVYRALSTSDPNPIRPGDWIALERSYAETHASGGYGDVGSKIIEEKIPANDVVWAGTDVNEWIYAPKASRNKDVSVYDYLSKPMDTPAIKELKSPLHPVEDFAITQSNWDEIRRTAPYVSKSKPDTLVTVSPSTTRSGWTRLNFWNHEGIWTHLEVPDTDVQKTLRQQTYPRGQVIVSVTGGVGGSLPSESYAGFGFEPYTTGAKGIKAFVGPRESVSWMTDRLGSGGYKVEVRDVPEQTISQVTPLPTTTEPLSAPPVEQKPLEPKERRKLIKGLGGTRVQTQFGEAGKLSDADLRRLTELSTEQPTAKEAKQSVKEEKPNARTGLTSTQTGYLAGELEDYADRHFIKTDQYPSGAKDKADAVDFLEHFAKVNKSTIGSQIGEKETIEVPGDGEFTVGDVAAANKLHQKITGQPIEGMPKAQGATVRVGTTQRVSTPERSVSDLVDGAIHLYGDAKTAHTKLTDQWQQVKDNKELAEGIDVSKLETVINELRDRVDADRSMDEVRAPLETEVNRRIASNPNYKDLKATIDRVQRRAWKGDKKEFDKYATEHEPDYYLDHTPKDYRSQTGRRISIWQTQIRRAENVPTTRQGNTTDWFAIERQVKGDSPLKMARAGQKGLVTDPETRTENFRRWFAGSKVVDGQGEPLVVYTGHQNLEMYGDKFDPRKATAGAFYASESPDISSNYSLGKLGNKEWFEDGAQYRFRLKNGSWGKKLWQLEFTPEQQKTVRDYIKEQGYDVEDYWRDNARYDADARRALARGGLRDAQSVYKFLESMGDNIAYAKEGDEPYFMRQRKGAFEEILDKLGIDWQSFDWSQPGVMPVYLSIKNPLDADKPFPSDLLQALKSAARYERIKPYSSEVQWTTEYPLREWIKDIESGDEFWTTQIPKKALPILKQFGYDGIKERGLKGADLPRSERQVNWIAFDPQQIKSASGNRGTFDVNDPNILKMAEPKDVRATENAAALVPNIEIERDADILKVNDSGQEFLRRTFEQNAINQGEIEGAAESPFEAVFLDPKDVRATVKTLHQAAREMREKGYTEEEAKKLENLAEQTRAAARAGKGTAIVMLSDAPRAALPHESFHQGAHLGAEGKVLEERHARLDELAKHTAVEKWREFYGSTPEYQNASGALAVEEAAATIAGGDYDKIGVSLDEAVDYLDQWFDSYIEKNGDQSVEEFRRQREDVQQIIEAARTRYSAKGRGVDEATSKREPEGDVNRARPPDRSVPDVPATEEQTTPDTQAGVEEVPQAEGSLKHRSLPRTLRAKGLEAADQLYETYPNKAALADAKKLFDRLGFNAAEALLKSDRQKGAEDMALSDLLQRALLNTASEASTTDPELAAELRQRQQDLASTLAVQATRAGQFIQAAQASAHSVEDVLATAERVAKERGTPLTETEVKRIQEAGEQLERATAEVEVAGVDAGGMAAQVEAEQETLARADEGLLTKEEVKRIQKRLKELKERELERTKEGATLAGKLAGMRERLASLAGKEKRREQRVAELEGKLPPRERKTNRVQDRQKAIELLSVNEADLMADLRSILGDTNYLKMSAAWHGSPHRFDKFSTEHIGSGEGAQSYGHGLYFAGKREVAEYYKEANKATYGDTSALYHVELAPDEDEYLLWDKPLSEQSGRVKQALKGESRSIGGVEDFYLEGVLRHWRGEKFYRDLSIAHGGDKAASNYLHRLGIRGIKYLDQGSRSQGEGSYNYVIFSDKDVDIKEILKMARREQGIATEIDDEVIDKLAQVGAPRLLRAERGTLSVSEFKRSLIKDFGSRIKPQIDRIHAEAVRLQRQALKRVRYERTLERIASREGNEELSRDELETIAENERQEGRRAALVRGEHDRAAREFEKSQGGVKAKDTSRAEFGKAQTFVRGIARQASGAYQRTVGGELLSSRALAQAIGRNAQTDIEAIAAAKLALRPQSFTAEMKAERGLTNEQVRAAFRDGGRVLETSLKEINESRQMTAALKKRVVNSEAERDQALADLQEKRKGQAQAKRQVARQLESLRTSAVERIAKRVWRESKGIPIALMASGDMSSFLRQGGATIAMQPTLAPEFAAALFKSIGRKGHAKLINKIEKGKDFTLKQRMGVDFAFAGRGGEGGDEFFENAELLDRIPGIKQWVETSDRVFGGSLDELRDSLADVLIADLRSKGISYAKNPKAYKDIGRFINIITGRADIGNHNAALTKAFLFLGRAIGFAPRYRISRMQFLTLPLNRSFWHAAPPARRVIYKNYARWFSTMGAVYGILAALGWLTGGILSTYFDPDDDDFLKLKVGKARFDITGGLQVPARFIGRLLLEGYRGLTREVTPEMAGKQMLNITGRYLYSGLDPRASLAVEWWNQQTYDKRPFTWFGDYGIDGAIGTRLTPINVSQALETGKREGKGYATAQYGAEFLGAGTNVYPDRADEPRTKAEKLATRFAYKNDYTSSGQAIDEETKRKLDELKGRARSGEDVSGEVGQLVEADKINERKADSIINAKDQTYLQEKFRQLSLEDARHVLKYATPEEKEAVAEIMRGKELNAAEKQAKEEEKRDNPERTAIKKERAKRAQERKRRRQELRYGDRIDFAQ